MIFLKGYNVGMKMGLGLAVLICGVIAICGYYAGPQMQWIVFVFKPLTTILILAIAVLSPSLNRRYKSAVVAGILFSLAGDIFLMLPSDQFLFGLVSFLLAHICYLIAFTSDVGFGAKRIPFVALGIIAAAILSQLWPGIPEALRIPVIVYVTLLASMAAQAVGRWQALGISTSAWAAVGGVLFVASDGMLAAGRFGFPFAGSAALVLGTYYAAQFLIAGSIPSTTTKRT